VADTDEGAAGEGLKDLKCCLFLGMPTCGADERERFEVVQDVGV